MAQGWFGWFNYSGTQDKAVPPQSSRGLLSWLRQAFGGWPGSSYARGTSVEEALEHEKSRSGPAGITYPWFLPYIDDYTAETPAVRAAYRKMLADPNVKAAVLGKTFGVAALELKLQPADKKNVRDKEVADFVKWNLTRRLAGGVPGLVWSVLFHSLVDGYSVSEKVFKPQDTGKYRNKIALAKLKPKDTGNDVILQTDEYRNIVGVLGLRYNAGEEFHPSNFLIYRHLPLYDLPTGMSDFRAVYSRWWLLDTTLKLRAMGLEKRALPMLVGHYQVSSQKTSLEAALAQVKYSNWMSVPENVRVEAVDIAGRGDDMFRSAVQDLKHDIFLGIQGAILQNLEGETTDGRGDSQVHKSTSDLWKWFLANSIESALNDEEEGLIKDLVDLNYVVPEYPLATLSAVDVNELVQDMVIIQGLYTMKLPLSKEQLYEKFGYTPPEDPEDALVAPEQAAVAGGSQGGFPAAGRPGGNGSSATGPFAGLAQQAEEQAQRALGNGHASFAEDGAADRQVAGPRGDAAEAQRLLQRAGKQGSAVLSRIARSAVERLLGKTNPMNADKLFDDDEIADLAKALAATNATADLLGRSRIRERQEQVERRHREAPAKYAEAVDLLERFAEAVSRRAEGQRQAPVKLELPDQKPPVVHVNVPAPIVNIHIPEQKPPVVHVPQQAAPVVHVEAPVVNVKVPEQKAPVVNVAPAQVDVHLPEQPAPVVQVTLPEQPAQPAPVVHIDAPIVNIEAPVVPPVVRREVERDGEGRIKAVVDKRE